MAYLIAVTGLSGAGKTTAVNYLQEIGVGQKIYLGQAILAEVRTRGLPAGPDSEREVRSDFRQQYGPAALAVLAGPQISECLNQDTNVLIDAIFDDQEYTFIRSLCPSTSSFLLFSVLANFDTRSGRLAVRGERPCTREQLASRDEFELSQLGTQNVIDRAKFKIVNEVALDDFEGELQNLWNTIRAASS
jgi:dephospho-CoA kinase